MKSSSQMISTIYVFELETEDKISVLRFLSYPSMIIS